MKSKIKNIILDLLIILILCVSIFYIVYPIYDSRVNRKQTELEAITAFEKSIMDQVKERDKVPISSIDISQAENKIVGIIYIPKISLTLPVFNNVSEYAISNGVGLIKELGYPSQDKGTNPVLTSHSGESTSSLFTNLERLEISDPYYIKRFDGTIYKYEVFDIETVLPNQVEKLKPESTKAITTLLTCVPFGVNSHRLLVKGDLVDSNYREEDIESARFFLAKNEIYSVVLIFFMLTFIAFILTKRRRNNEK